MHEGQEPQQPTGDTGISPPALKEKRTAFEHVVAPLEEVVAIVSLSPSHCLASAWVPCAGFSFGHRAYRKTGKPQQHQLRVLLKYIRLPLFWFGCVISGKLTEGNTVSPVWDSHDSGSHMLRLLLSSSLFSSDVLGGAIV